MQVSLNDFDHKVLRSLKSYYSSTAELPSIRVLTQSMGNVGSRGKIHKSITKLKQAGLVEYKKNKLYFIFIGK